MKSPNLYCIYKCISAWAAHVWNTILANIYGISMYSVVCTHIHQFSYMHKLSIRARKNMYKHMLQIRALYGKNLLALEPGPKLERHFQKLPKI